VDDSIGDDQCGLWHSRLSKLNTVSYVHEIQQVTNFCEVKWWRQNFLCFFLSFFLNIQEIQNVEKNARVQALMAFPGCLWGNLWPFYSFYKVWDLNCSWKCLKKVRWILVNSVKSSRVIRGVNPWWPRQLCFCMTDCLRRLHCIQSLQKLQVLYTS
jgi:hypothetical protein